MAQEAAEIPSVAARLLLDARPIARAAAALVERAPRFAVICGRGSSGHVGTYLRYLIETRLRIVASFAAPSVVTSYDRQPNMANGLFVVISQSGQSPDLVAALRAAAADGAITIGIVNDVESPVAKAADIVIPVSAGEEKSVAATKSVVNSMLACACLIGQAAGDRDLLAATMRMPDRLAAALSLDWSAWGETLGRSRATFVTARGFGLGPAREIALKVAETIGAPALAYSAAELRHGPRASVTSDTPVLALRQADATAPTIDRLRADLAANGARVLLAGGPASELPWIGDDHPTCDPICMLVPAYRSIEREARSMGLDPDRPPFLNKVTRTF
ncbi:SIS domain-containing protein [Phreatobacter sp.]|uniref:SIS domain-containing protein n=1 Tax=Phreatobacter sp. TaxID=1966341 RepID=UPI00345CB378